MDFARPVQAVIPGVQGRILAVVAETSAELNLRTIARLAGVSIAQASRVLPELVEVGIIDRRDVPPSSLFRFVPEHVAARAVAALANARRTVLDELGQAATHIDPSPRSVIAFGSLARGEADRESDIDILIVRPDGLDEDDERWRASVERWSEGARRLTGSRIEVLEVEASEAVRSLRGRSQLWLDIRRDGIVLHGSDPAALEGRRIA